ncbi:MAG: metallophosphoesterase [Clostridia bacterium]|nr:metallophosphoesterase [Clostridia bacterium]
MTYAISDIHGCFDKYLAMIDLISLKTSDKLYILGDVIDRGDRGIRILRDMMRRKNVIPILGNHEFLAKKVLAAEATFPDQIDRIAGTKAHALWMLNSGDTTESEFLRLSREEQIEVVEYIDGFMLFDEIAVGGRRFHLSHTLPEYDENKDIHDVSAAEFVWGEPDYEIRYDPDVTFITGHTPTSFIDRSYSGKIWRGNGHVAIDCGAVFEGGRLGCICLDTMEEIYA